MPLIVSNMKRNVKSVLEVYYLEALKNNWLSENFIFRLFHSLSKCIFIAIGVNNFCELIF